MTAGTSDGFLLNGRVRYAQPVDGYRTGVEPVLLAAAVPARAGERVLEAGTGAGAGMLCLAARVPGVVVVGVEQDPAMADLARRNLAANGAALLHVCTGDIVGGSRREPAGADAWRTARYDHAFANPPWHDPRSSASPMPGRDSAKRGGAGPIGAWCLALAARLRPRGTLTLILPAASLGDGVAALMSGGLGAIAVLPLLPRIGRPARLVLLQGLRGRGGDSILPSLALHGPAGYSDAANAVLREVAALDMRPRMRRGP